MPTQSLKSVPDHVPILGGGYVGLEFAPAMRRFGSRVTIVERNERLLHREDEEVSEAIMRIFIAERIELVTGGRLKEVDGRSGEQVTPHLEFRPKE
jgi:pyruvate/2-oxoglutarate dehydrogenase complex dihydrolipoamide dehydrogenase (E3) component